MLNLSVVFEASRFQIDECLRVELSRDAYRLRHDDRERPRNLLFVINGNHDRSRSITNRLELHLLIRKSYFIYRLIG